MIKTVMINFWPNNSPNSKEKLIFDGIEIPIVKFTKFLGVYLDENLDWIYHTSQ